tara:strand:- start:120 stop:1073 length:954 start_codon:yes stop_codon:yes gene_type:complete
MFSFKEIDLIDSQKIWETSPNANVFNNPKILNYIDNIEIYGVYNGEELICCWPIKIENDSSLIPYFFYYFGPFWSKVIETIPNHSWLKLSNEVYGLYCKNFSKKFKNICFELHYSLDDVRIFDWWNYHETNKKRFLIQPKYTAIIDDLTKKTEQQILKDYRYVRRYELKNFEKNLKLIERTEINVEEIEKFYFDNVNIENINDYKIGIKKSINIAHNLVKNGFGEVFCYREKKNKEIICLLLILNDKKSSHLILSLGTKDWKSKGMMTYALHKAITESKNKLIDIFDFNGANSPERGDHKHSFGSKVKLFFNLSLKN